jgi:hypothetical protein
MAGADDTGAAIRHRWVISSEPPFWVVTFYAPGLPAEGARHRFRTHAEACEAFWHLYPQEFRGSGVVTPEYDLGPDTMAKYSAYDRAFLAKLAANDRYAEAGAEITSTLAGRHQASLRDIASMLHLSYWRVVRLRAHRPIGASRLYLYFRWIRSPRAERRVLLSLHAAGTLGRQAHIVAADAIREAGHAAAERRANAAGSGR